MKLPFSSFDENEYTVIIFIDQETHEFFARYLKSGAFLYEEFIQIQDYKAPFGWSMEDLQRLEDKTTETLETLKKGTTPCAKES